MDKLLESFRISLKNLDLINEGQVSPRTNSEDSHSHGRFQRRTSSGRRNRRRGGDSSSTRSDDTSSGQSTDEESIFTRRPQRERTNSFAHVAPRLPPLVDITQPALHGVSYLDENIPTSLTSTLKEEPQSTTEKQSEPQSFTMQLFEVFSNLMYALGKHRAENNDVEKGVSNVDEVQVNTGETSMKRAKLTNKFDTRDIDFLAAEMQDKTTRTDSLLIKEQVKLEETIFALKALQDKERWAIGALFVCVSDSWENVSLLNRIFDHLQIAEGMRGELREISGQGYDPALFLNNIPPHHYWSIIWDCLILAVAGGQYDARYRISLRKLCEVLSVQWERFLATEDGLAIFLRKEIDLEKCTSAIMESESNGRWWKIGIGAVVGGSALMLTGGLAAPLAIPVVSSASASMGLGLHATFLGFGGVKMLTGLFGAAGAGLTGYKIAKRTAGVEEFGFEQIGADKKGMPVYISVSGWLHDELDDFTSSWKCLTHLNAFGEFYSLQWESKHLVSLGEALNGFFSRKVASVATKYWATQASKTLAVAASAMQWPLTLLSLADLIDNPWNMAADRAQKAGKILAEVLMQGVHGTRPVTLVGYSVGARLIFFCLEELAKNQCKGIVENVILMGCPISLDEIRWANIRSVVAGRLVNCYSNSDWILLFLYRAAHFSKAVAGLTEVPYPGVENYNITHLVKGHSKYPESITSILQFVGFERL